MGDTRIRGVEERVGRGGVSCGNDATERLCDAVVRRRRTLGRNPLGSEEDSEFVGGGRDVPKMRLSVAGAGRWRGEEA